MQDVEIIFQNEEIIVIDKPIDLSVHRGIGNEGATLVDFLVEKFPETMTVGDDPRLRPGIVHRLDKDTSGVMIIARNQKSFEYLKDLFKNRKIEKKYFALVHGIPKNKEGKIEGEMGRSKRDFRKQALVRGKIAVRKERYSLTHYHVIEESDNFALLEVFPKTGRMHQIRVHLHSIGHPIVGDNKYFFKEFKKNRYDRLYLHAGEISFKDEKGLQQKFQSTLPEEFDTLIAD